MGEEAGSKVLGIDEMRKANFRKRYGDQQGPREGPPSLELQAQKTVAITYRARDGRA